MFGSEIKAILAHPEVKAKVDRSGLAEIFGLGPSRSPGSGVFKGVKEIRPGHAMIFSKDGLTVWRYWNVKSEKHTDSFDETVENVRSLFQDAVTRQLVSDVPVCTFYLEGSIRAPLPQRPPSISREKGRRPFIRFRSIMKTMSNILRQAHFSQTPTARGLKMSDAFGTVHHNCVISQEELAAYLEEAVLVRDLPGMADVDSSLLWFCREIKKTLS